MAMTDAQMYNAGAHTCASAALWLERLTRLAQQTLGLTVDGKLGPATMRAVARWEAGGDGGAQEAERFYRAFVTAAETQVGKPYRWGAEVSLDDPDPKDFDCSELVQWAAAQAGGKAPDGAFRQCQRCIQLSIETALRTPGALLFRFSGDPFGNERPERAHVAISLGYGFTVEAKSPKDGVGIFPTAGRKWTHAGLLPVPKGIAP